MAAARPLGPPPTISTGTWSGTAVIGSPVLSCGAQWMEEGGVGLSGPAGARWGSVAGGLPLPDECAAVVVAVRRAQHGVDVEGLGGVVVQEDAAVVVELGDEHRGL